MEPPPEQAMGAMGAAVGAHRVPIFGFLAAKIGQTEAASTNKDGKRLQWGGAPGFGRLLPKHLQSGEAVWGLPWGHKSGPQLFVGIGTIATRPLTD